VKKRAELIVNLSVLKKNYSLLEELCPRKKMIVMIKANAYGHGDAEVYSTLKECHSLDSFGVASIEEALSLRQRTKCFKKPLVVFSDLFLKENGYAKDYAQNKIIPVLADFPALEFFLSSSDCSGIPLFLKINTGMNRLGFSFHDVKKLIKVLKNHGVSTIDHIMTHLSDASSTNVSGSKSRQQTNLFTEIKSLLLDNGISIIDSSISNSSGILQGLVDDETHVRPGLVLYGPCSENLKLKWKGEMVSSLRTHVINSFNVKKGDEIGYGSSKCDRNGRAYVLGVGYGDGLGTCFSGKTIPLPKGDATVVGRVNMDMTLIMFEKELDKFKSSEFVELWGSDQAVFSKFASSGGVLSYELLCGLSERVNRLYQKCSRENIS
jgi:alanine racemase